MKKVVCIGGGSGQAALLKGLKQLDNISLSTIVAMADNGGSTGRLRTSMQIPAIGDIRNVMVALAEREDLMTSIMDYRFDSNSGELSGHSLGNLIIAALTRNSNDLLEAITDLSNALKIKGQILPSTTQQIDLKAVMDDGSIVTGESEIRDSDKQIVSVFYDQEVKTYPKVIEAIENADYVIVGIGSLFTSVLPNLIIEEIKEALNNCSGKVVYYCNSMSEHGETDGYSLEDHVAAIERHLGKKVIDAVVFGSDEIPESCLISYAKELAAPIYIRDAQHDYKVIRCPLLSFKNNLIRHDGDKVRDSFIKVMEEL